MSEKSKNKNKKLLFIIIVGLIVFVSVITLLLIIIQVPYTYTEYYYEKEPYTKEVCKDIRIKSNIEWGTGNNICINEICDRHEQYCVEKNWYGGCVRYRERCMHYACTKYRKYCRLNIQNIDDAFGTWKFDGYSYDKDLDRPNFINEVIIYVKPMRTEEGTWDFVYDAGENMGCYYLNVEHPKKRVCEKEIAYREVKKSREVTRYCNAWKKIIGRC